MKIFRNNLKEILFATLCLGTVSGFQNNKPLVAHRSISANVAVRIPTLLHLNTPPQFPNDDEFDPSPFGENSGEPPAPTQGIPKLKLPTPSFSMPEIEFKDILIRIAALVATGVAFVAIQKAGLLVSGLLTPELTAEQVRDFRL